MNAEQRTALIARTILEGLADCGSHLLPEPQLVTHVQISVTPPPTKLECEQRIKALEDGGYIVGVTPGIGGPRKWRITDLGRTELQ